MNDHTATEQPQAAPAVGAQVDRRVRRPRVTTLQRDEDAFQGRYKQHDLDMLRAGWDSNWYIRVRAPSGLYAYDGYWLNSQGKSLDDAITEACTGACLWTPNAKLTGQGGA